MHRKAESEGFQEHLEVNEKMQIKMKNENGPSCHSSCGERARQPKRVVGAQGARRSLHPDRRLQIRRSSQMYSPVGKHHCLNLIFAETGSQRSDRRREVT